MQGKGGMRPLKLPPEFMEAQMNILQPLLRDCLTLCRKDANWILSQAYIHTYTLLKLEIQCSCRANIFEKKAKIEIKICYRTISILFINYIQLEAKREN